MTVNEPQSSATAPASPAPAPTIETVEALVRHQLAVALGGKRGMIEAALPGAFFTAIFLGLKDVRMALIAAVACAVVLVVVRLLQRSSMQFVLNSLVGVAIGYGFAQWAAKSGGSAEDQALAFFLPGILFSLGYVVVFGASCLVGWPVLGFMLGAGSEDPLAWHKDKQVVRLCTRITWLFLLPSLVGVLLQGPVWLAGSTGLISASTAVATIALLRYALGWPLRVLAWSTAVWLLARDHTPLVPVEDD